MSGMLDRNYRPEWIDRLRRCAGTDEQGTFSVMYIATRLWPLMCDVIEHAEMERTTKCECPVCDALIRLRDEVRT